MAESTPELKTTNPNDSDKTEKTVGHVTGGDAGPPALDAEPLDDGKWEPEEALETHEVVELNKFTTKKEWIEEKIKLLESIPPVEVFAAVEALATMSEEIPPGLPTRAQLDHWLDEHDKTEKETEIFDAEDMSKLKKLTKAATQRNLSPEDTDLIELTLTTLLALDKLLHLLRDRSEVLDLLGLRLTWEEQRVAAWRDRSAILEDLQSFLTSRARWSLDTYELPLPSTPSPSPALRFTSPSPSPRPSISPMKRRDSTASLTSISSDTSISTGPSSAFSRSTRYKLAELLSHDAALFSGRLTTLNHGKIMLAGKTLDKLIDASRTPVPDEILDEQDRLEDKGIKEIETVGKFAMTVVMQWKRADEHYNDTKKDQAAAQALIAEINNATLQHPTARHDAAFMSRAQALTKRLAVKGDPALPRSSFPRPVHPLFPDQAASNQEIVKTLSTELSEAVKLAREAESAAHAYHAGLEAVKRAESLRDQMNGLDQQIKKLVGSLTQGIHNEHGHGDGSPLDLNNETCLDPMRHATFLALLPSVVQQLDTADRSSELALREGKAALLHLKRLPGIDIKLNKELISSMEVLEGRRSAAKHTKGEVLAQAQRLKEARRLWVILNDIMRALESITNDVVDGIDSQKWKVRDGHSGAPLTPDPDSPTPSQASLPTTLTPDTLLQQLDCLEKRVSAEFKASFGVLAQKLEHPLYKHLQSSSDGVSKRISDIRSMARLWDDILKQTESMLGAKREAHDLEGKLDMLQTGIDDARRDILDKSLTVEDAAALEVRLRDEAILLQSSVRTFTDSLAARVPFVARSDRTQTIHTRPNSSSKSPPSIEQRLNSLMDPPALTLPFDLSTLDDGVRAEVNMLALRLAGGLQSVDKKLDYLRLACLAKATDIALEILVKEVKSSQQVLSDIKGSFESSMKVKPSGLDVAFSQKLSSTREQLDSFTGDHRSRISRSISPARQALDTLQDSRGAHDSPVHGTLVAPRVKSVDEALRRADSINEQASQLRAQIAEAEKQEGSRLRTEKERVEAEERAKLEMERLEAEKKARLEKERIEAEALARQEQEKLEAEERAKQETARHEAEKANLASIERERLAAENIARLKAQRIEEERVEAENALKAANEKVAYVREQEKLSSRETQDTVSSKSPRTPEEDVFGLRLAPSMSTVKPLSQEMSALRARIMSLRSRLRSLSLGNLVRSSDKSHVAVLPTSYQASDIQSKFSAVLLDITTLPTAVEDASIASELRSLRSEADSARASMERAVQLGQFTDKVAICDHALSDLLEHADCYPAAPPAHQLASTHISDSRRPCEEQLANRLAFTKQVMDEMSQLGSSLADDLRVMAEERRLQQTSTELVDMCMDRINGTRSRPTSSVSSTGGSSHSSLQRKPKASLNSHTLRRPRASESTPRRVVSGAHDPIPRPSTHLSNRSVSGPTGFSSLFSTTFASRQRTTSLASIPSATPTKRPMSPVRSLKASKRPSSPTFSEISGQSFASTPSRSTWSRAPRESFGTVPKSFQFSERPSKRKAYVANPKSKLDIAVGNVVNNFKVPVTIQAAGDGWKDQSGKYWIGEAEPKLCFCRILRSQTVMVRVGGGWCELSNFLRGHFAELSVELPPSPPRKEERWISSATVLEASETSIPSTINAVSKTPETQRVGSLPAIQLSTPNGTSPQSIKTSSSPGGSPGLTALQFLRKADPGARAVTPSPSKSSRSKPTTPSTIVTPARTNIWRP